METKKSNPACNKTATETSFTVKERLRRGDTRPDGKVFWQYTYGGRGQIWVSKSKFDEKVSYSRDFLRKYKKEKKIHSRSKGT